MKKRIVLMLACVLTLSLCGCAGEPAETTAPTETIPSSETTLPESMVPETTAPAELTLPAGPEEVCTQMPFVIGIVTDPDAEVMEVQMNKLVWDVGAGTLSEPEYQYTFEYMTVFDILVDYWGGGTVLKPNIGTQVTDVSSHVTTVNGLTYGYGVYHGKYASIPENQSIRGITEDGSWVEYPLPRNNPDVIDPEFNTVWDPHYATVIGDIGIAAFVRCEDYSAPGKLTYCVFHVDCPDEARWNTVEIPVEHNVDVFTNWNGAYNDGVLYLASRDALLAVELETGELTELDRNNLFAPVFEEFSGYTRAYNDRISSFVLEGSQDGTLVAQISFYNEDGEVTVVFVAFRGDTILGVMAQDDGGVFTFYDGEMNQINESEAYQHKFLNSIVQFARDD